jgi:hypothetical protein
MLTMVPGVHAGQYGLAQVQHRHHIGFEDASQVA